MSAIHVKTNEIRFPVAPNLYGLFFEDINRSGDGGLYPEMLRNRTFEDSILPERCTLLENGLDFTTPRGWKDQFNNGEGLRRWITDLEPTDIPGWYCRDAAIRLEHTDVLNDRRKAALSVSFQPSGVVYNVGYRGVPAQKGATYNGYFFLKSDAPCTLTVSIASKDLGTVYGCTTIRVASDCYTKYDYTITCNATDYEAVLAVSCAKRAELRLGYSSLMPSDTFKGHGLRKDLAELLAHTSSKFFRFPGGCIVEGFTKETSMRFYHTIGPEWERPSHNLMWHYRTSNGLGYHEYLQLCEDLGLEPLYVINCGLTCQGRREELFEGEELTQWVQEAMDAIDYAIAPSDTPMGKLRAAAGHPEPFKMTYVEIGNENIGPEYVKRYRLFYDALKERYPQIQFIANIHVEREGCQADIVDEHYYNTPEFFARQFHMFDDYDRKGPDIFVGEYAVTNGNDVGNLRSAIAESMYLMGIENNQDIVTLTAYAPLFNHVDYTSWTPDLIAYNNHASYGIPFYHALTMLAANRGEHVVAVDIDSPAAYEDLTGLTGIVASGDGVRIRNMTCNGVPVAPTHNIVSELREEDGTYLAWETDNSELMRSPGLSVKEVLQEVKSYITFGEEEVRSTVFEADLWLSDPSVKTSLAFWIHNNTMLHNQDETRCGESKLWTPIYTNRYVWSLDNHEGYIDAITRSRYSFRGPHKYLPELAYGCWMKVRIEAEHDCIRCYLNGKLVQEQPNVHYPTVSATAAVAGDEIILKVANLGDAEDPIAIGLDCDVAADYEVTILTGDDPKLENDFEHPLAVSPVTKDGHGAAKNFVYYAPAYSLNILKLRRK